jgi:hypothetical protein
MSQSKNRRASARLFLLFQPPTVGGFPPRVGSGFSPLRATHTFRHNRFWYAFEEISENPGRWRTRKHEQQS